MGNRISAKQVLGIAAVCLAVATCPDSASGQVTASAFYGTGDFVYDIQSMPDLDQKRETLFNDGSMYCVPTANMNLLAYAANFGFDGLPPYPGIWQGETGHDSMTTWIGWLGLFMETDGATGTTTTGKITGMNNWISEAQQPMCVVASYRKENFWPTIDHAAAHATNGAIVQFSYGRYFWEPGYQGVPVITQRNGGHAVTLKLAYADNGAVIGPRLIHYRNPGSDDGDLTSNSDFSSDWPTTAANIDVSWDSDGNGAWEYFAVTSLVDPPDISADDNRLRLVDSLLALYPGGGLSYSDVEVNSVFVGGNLGFVQDQDPSHGKPASGYKVAAVVPHPEMLGSLWVEKSSAGVARLRQFSHNGTSTLLTQLPADTSCATLGFGHEMFVSSGRNIYRIDLSAGVPKAVRTGSAPAAIEHLAWDEARFRLFGIAAGRAGFFDVVRRKWTDLGVPEGLGRGTRLIRQLMVDGDTVYAALSSGVVATADLSAPRGSRGLRFQLLTLPQVSDAVSVDIDSQGRMYVSDRNTGLLEFEFDRELGWQSATRPLYEGQTVPGRKFVVFKNRTNIFPGELDEREWFDIEPESLGDSVLEIGD